jgi:hypothetical protein
MGAVTSPLPFIGVDPCRIVDTRQAGFPAGYGPPALTGGVPRNFTLAGQCGIPSLAAAVSLNVTVTNAQGPGFILIYPQGGTQPNVSTLNYVAGQTIANAAVVPLGTGGGITVIAGVSGTDLILDTNGYYAGAGVGDSNTFLGLNAGNFTMTGDGNTAIGASALFSNTSGENNTASGVQSLFNNTTGYQNTGTGSGVLFHNTAGAFNTALGAFALYSNTGDDNTALGAEALIYNTTGINNTAIGDNALAFNTMGSDNIALGYRAGSSLTTGHNNICIGDFGIAGESNTIRIGSVGTSTAQSATYIAGISGQTSPGGVAVFVNSSGQLGTVTSSRRVKEDIREIAEESDGLMRLRPVAFKYKAQIDPTGLAQYGLIAEEVADVYPDLVANDRDGRPETVRYHLVNALLLNEVQKQHRTAEAQERTIEQQKETIDHEQTEIEGLNARLRSLEARLPTERRSRR